MLTTSARSDPPPEGDEAGADDEQGVSAASLATLKQVALSASRARSAEAFLGEAVEPLARLMGSDLASILLLEGNHLYQAAAIGLPDEYLEAIDGVEIGPKEGSCGSAADTYSHLAGAGRGDGWAGNIELHSGDSPFLPALAQVRPSS